MYNLLKSEDTILKATEEEWLSQTKSLGDFGVMVADDVKNIFDRIKNNKVKEEQTYFLVKKGSSHGEAILKVLQAFPQQQDKSWLKLLKIRLEPKLNIEGKDTETSEDATIMYLVLAASILEAIGLIFVRQVNKLKIYGRTPEMRGMFAALLTDKDLQEVFSNKGLSARAEGAWLVVEKL